MNVSYSGDQTKNEMGGIRETKQIHTLFRWGTLWEGDHLEEADAEENIILVLKRMMGSGLH
jgi:hypothetical protein